MDFRGWQRPFKWGGLAIILLGAISFSDNGRLASGVMAFGALLFLSAVFSGKPERSANGNVVGEAEQPGRLGSPTLGDPLSLRAVFADAWLVYRLLFRRSVVTAAFVYAVYGLIDSVQYTGAPGSLRTLAAIAAFVASFAAPAFVQGALVEIVRNLHEGRAPATIKELYLRAESRFWRLLGGSIVYGLGVFGGLLLLFVPGLIVAARWALIAPSIMLEGRGIGAARIRSATLVRGRTGSVLAAVVITFAITSFPYLAVFYLSGSYSSTVPYLILVFAWHCLTAPFEAHVLTVLYYRLAEPELPVIDPAVLDWRSLWRGA